jgi:hypothetical protein
VTLASLNLDDNKIGVQGARALAAATPAPALGCLNSNAAAAAAAQQQQQQQQHSSSTAAAAAAA